MRYRENETLKNTGSLNWTAGVVLTKGRQICESVASQRMGVLVCSRVMDVLNESSEMLHYVYLVWLRR